MKKQRPFEKLMNINASNIPQPVSGRTILLIIGGLAILLPIILILGSAIMADCEMVQNSISAYYHTIMRDFFVGSICSISIGMFAYYGYSSFDNQMANIAGIFALGVAFLPTSVGLPISDCINSPIDNGMIGTLHYISAAFLFLILAFFCLYLFTISDEKITDQKRIRNTIYKICGYTILICIVLIAIYTFILKGSYSKLDMIRPVFFLETFSLIAFSFSWLIKGKLLLVDK